MSLGGNGHLEGGRSKERRARRRWALAAIAIASFTPTIGDAGIGVALSAVTRPSSISVSGTRPPTRAERVAILRWVKHWWRYDPAFAAARVGRHPVVKNIRVARRDRHFAGVDIVPVNTHGQQTLETATTALMLAGGEWYVILSGTDFAPICLGPSPQAIVDLFCHR